MSTFELSAALEPPDARFADVIVAPRVQPGSLVGPKSDVTRRGSRGFRWTTLVQGYASVAPFSNGLRTTCLAGPALRIPTSTRP